MNEIASKIQAKIKLVSLCIKNSLLYKVCFMIKFGKTQVKTNQRKKERQTCITYGIEKSHHAEHSSEEF